MKIKRRYFLKNLSFTAMSAAFIPGWITDEFLLSKKQRVRPGDLLWPSGKIWDQLKEKVHGHLVKLPILAELSAKLGKPETLLKRMKNPYFISNHPALTQTTGWIDAWETKPSVYAITAKTAHEVASAVRFAVQHNLRLVIKGGGHSYQGTSNSADSLLIWTRPMNEVEMHDHFVLSGDPEKKDVGPAVTIGAGALWLQVYHEVTTKGGRYVQGGGCTTVGVAGLVQSGGFGSFSKNFGTAAASLLEAEVVTADGQILVANQHLHPELFWAIKGGGGGGFAAVTKLTLKTHDLPETFGGVFTRIRAKSDEAFRELIKKFIAFYREQLFNPTWGESIAFHRDNTMSINMVFQGISGDSAKATWSDFETWVATHPGDFQLISSMNILAMPARSFWNVDFFKQFAPHLILMDDSPNASANDFYWASNAGEAGQYLSAYHSLWMPSALLQSDNLHKLAEALFLSSRHWTISLHFNKGLAGGKPDMIERVRDTAMNPAVTDAFALAIIAGEGPPAIQGMPGYEAAIRKGKVSAADIGKAFDEIEKLAPQGGAYVSESNYFQKDWQRAFWGANYNRLLMVKKKYDPGCLFFTRHGVGTEDWSEDGFRKLR